MADLGLVGSKTDELADVLGQLVTFLKQHGQDFWADWLERDLAWIRAGDFYGVRHLLQAYGGMGTLNDIYFTPANGNAATEEEGERLNQELERLSHDVWVLADGLRRAHDRRRGS